jgi:hypothetical protein
MAITSLLDSSLPETVISEDKSQEIIDLIKERFTETDHAPVAKQKEALLEGDRSSDSHILSRKMMQVYIASFWSHFHSQLPICEYYFIDSRIHITQLKYFLLVLLCNLSISYVYLIYRSRHLGP